MLKFKYVVFIALLLVFALMISACGRKGEPSFNEWPTIRITSYSGVEEPSLIDSLNPIAFQQQIYWEANDADGTVDRFAFRVTDEFGNPLTNEGIEIGVPGYYVVDDEGWVYHYLDGADESIPLEETAAKTIWTNQVYAVINFPAANADGDSIPVTSIFEVKCMDNLDNECLESAKKYYFANSEIPSCKISSSKGDVNGKTIGTGIIFTFNIFDGDQFVGNIPDYFEFRFERKDLIGSIIPEDAGGYDDSLWWSTKDFEEVDQVFISLDDEGGTRPAMKLNEFVNGVTQDSTYLIAKAYDLSGIVSQTDTISFVVKEGFYPSTLIYNGMPQAGYPTVNDVFVLGANHFTPYNPLQQIIPSTLTSEGYHFSTPLFIDKNGEYACVHSDDLRIYMHWGYHGEFVEGNPILKIKGEVLDELTGSQYFSAIRYFDVRLDGEAYSYAPLPAEEYNYVDEATGKEWLRIPAANEIAQETIITGLGIGIHRFEVRAVDLQNAPDETPAEFIINVVAPVPVEEKEGILILFDIPFSSQAPTDSIVTRYAEKYFADYTGTVDALVRSELETTIWNSVLHWGNDVFCPTDLQNYKTVVYVSDVPSNPGNSFFHLEYDVLNLYLRGGGNLILSSGANLDFKIQTGLNIKGFPILDKYFGIETEEEESIVAFATAINESKSYFIKALASETVAVNDIDLKIPGFSSLVNNSGSLAPVAYFNTEYLSEEVEIMYNFGCKAVGDGALDPTQSEFDFYSSKPVALKKVTGDSKCYIFGFPLAFMETEQVKTMLMQLINEIEE